MKRIPSKRRMKNTLVAGLFQKIMAKALEKSTQSPSDELSQDDLERCRKKLEKSKQLLKRPPRRRRSERVAPSKPKKKKKSREPSPPPPKERSPSPPPMDPIIRYEYEPMEEFFNTTIMVPEIAYEVDLAREPIYEQQYEHYIYLPYC